MKRIGLIGIASNTAQLLESIKQLHQFQLVGIFDPEQEKSKSSAKDFGLPFFNHPLDLIAESDLLHFNSSAHATQEYASLAIRSSRHLFLGGQYLTQLTHAQKLSELAQEAQIKVGISRTDRYNEALLKAHEFVDNPSFIECRRAVTQLDSQHSLRSLLLRDVDLVISFANSTVKRIQTRSSNSFDQQANMVNVRIEFNNGCVANINLSTISNVPYSKMAIYQHNAMINIDLQELSLEVLNAQAQLPKIASMSFHENTISNNTIKLQFQNFNRCIDENLSPRVGLDDAIQALQIIEEVERQLK